MEAEHIKTEKAGIVLQDENIIEESTELTPLLPDENDDITEYLTGSSFEKLKNRFAEAEEDESIRNEDFNPLTSGKATKKGTDDDIRSNPSFKKDVFDSEISISLASEFGSADSAYDNDAISFGDINIDLDSLGALVSDDSDIEIDRNEKYNTNTRVIYIDENADDGIKRNTDLEVSDVFSDN